MLQALGNATKIFLLLPLLGTGCAEDTEAVEAVLRDHEDVLTATDGDRLFIIDVSAAASAYPVNELLVLVEAPNVRATKVELTLAQDANGDGKLGEADILVATEPPLNILDEADRGVEHTVELFHESSDGHGVVLWTGVWVAD